MHLPVVDFRSPTAAQDFCRSLHETGFGVLRNHPLEQSMVEGIYAEWLAFFQTEAKHKYLTDPAKHDGYFPPSVSEIAKNHTRRDLKEFFHLYPWGRYPAEVSDAARRYYQAGSSLAGTLLGWVEELRPKRTILIHMDHSMDYASLVNELPNGVEPGYDGMTVPA